MTNAPDVDGERRALATRHLRFGWWVLFVSASLGLVLETLHGFKVGAYLDVSNDTRRLMWTLAHAHGAMLALINVAFGVTLAAGLIQDRGHALTSRCLLGASLLMPIGFFLGGIVVYAGDPGPGVLLVPIGGLLLLVALVLIARAFGGELNAPSAARQKRG